MKELSCVGNPDRDWGGRGRSGRGSDWVFDNQTQVSGGGYRTSMAADNDVISSRKIQLCLAYDNLCQV